MSHHMENKPILLLIILSLFVPKSIGRANNDCSPASCGPQEPDIRFPFRIIDKQPAGCGFPGFDLSCDEQNKTTIQLPSSLSYIVNRISYADQVIYIDPGFCRPNRIVSVNIAMPFGYSYSLMQRYDFFNCSPNFISLFPYVPFPCLSSGNYSVIAIHTNSLYPGYVPPNCKTMESIVVPVRPNDDIREAVVELMWISPSCTICEREGKTCKRKNDGGEVVCVGSSGEKGISRTAKYILGIGIGVPALICIIGFAYYAFHKVQGHNDSHNQSIEPSSVANNLQTASRTGLDEPTIESYPKSIFGESSSFRLADDDRTCAICLSDYKPKESLRTIPQCNHYFHSKCIDGWLKLNSTCPVCRNNPKSLTLVTPCYSASLAISRSVL